MHSGQRSGSFRTFRVGHHTEKIPKSCEDLTIEENSTDQSVSVRKIKTKLEVKKQHKEKIGSSSLTEYLLMDMEI